jgi:hypothetical protein
VRTASRWPCVADHEPRGRVQRRAGAGGSESRWIVASAPRSTSALSAWEPESRLRSRRRTRDRSRVRSYCPCRGLAVGSYCALGRPFFVTTGPGGYGTSLSIMRTSKGAEAALLVASSNPAVEAVIAISPTDVVWANMGHAHLGRRDVLVDPEEVVRVVLSLQGLQPVVLLRPVGLPDPLRTLIAQEIHIDAFMPRS